MKLSIFLEPIFVFLIILSLSFSIVSFEFAKAQFSSSTDPKETLKEFKDGKDSIQNDIQIFFNQLINKVKSHINFGSVDSHLSLASQNFINGKIPEGFDELNSANDEWKNSSVTVIKMGNELISIAKNNSVSVSNNTKEILDNFGNILVNIGNKIEDMRIQLSN